MSPQHPISASLCPPTRPPAASRKRCREESSLSPERDVHTRRMVELQHRNSQFPDVGDATAPENGLSSLTLGGQEKSRDVGVARGTAYRQLSAKQKHRMMENLRALYPVQFQICDVKVDPARWLKSHEICQRLEAAGLAPITAATMITRHSLHLATPPSHVANLEQQGTAISKALGFDLRLRRQTYVLYLPELEPNNSVSYQNDRAIEQLRADNDNIQVEKLVLRHSMWWLYVGNVKHALQVLDKNRFNARGQLSTVRAICPESVPVFCFKCCKAGHKQNQCRSRLMRCGKCSAEGEHSTLDCPIRRAALFRCPNCGKSGHASYHPSCLDEGAVMARRNANAARSGTPHWLLTTARDEHAAQGVVEPAQDVEPAQGPKAAKGAAAKAAKGVAVKAAKGASKPQPASIPRNQTTLKVERMAQ